METARPPIPRTPSVLATGGSSGTGTGDRRRSSFPAAKLDSQSRKLGCFFEKTGNATISLASTHCHPVAAEVRCPSRPRPPEKVLTVWHRPKPRFCRLDTWCGKAPKFRRLPLAEEGGKGRISRPQECQAVIPLYLAALGRSPSKPIGNWPNTIAIATLRHDSCSSAGGNEPKVEGFSRRIRRMVRDRLLVGSAAGFRNAGSKASEAVRPDRSPSKERAMSTPVASLLPTSSGADEVGREPEKRGLHRSGAISRSARIQNRESPIQNQPVCIGLGPSVAVRGHDENRGVVPLSRMAERAWRSS